jgi:signal transduction histidine kinase
VDAVERSEADGRGAGDALTGALRNAAIAASEAVGGGAALVFVGEPGGTGVRLRTAAGFAAPAAARSAAEAALALASEASFEGGPARCLEALAAFGPRGAGGLVVAPLAANDRVHGTLVVGAPQPVGEAALRAVAVAAGMAAWRLDHAQVQQELDDLRMRAADQARATEQKSDEILKLSEALFAQDIQLIQNHEKLGKIEKLKSDFIEKMSRELRTPLNSIIEAIISVLAGENEALSDGAKTSLREALDEGTAFLRTLQNILDLWRIKQSELPVEIQDVNFREVVDEAIFSVQDALGDKPVAIEKAFEEPFPKIRTDLAKINQVLFLLLENAVKYTEQGKIEIRSRVHDGQLICELQDTGIGICPDDQQTVFDEFYQVDEPNSTKYRGSGLGLALVRDLLILLDGSIALISDVGRGSTFTFQVPVQVVG